MSDRFSRNTTYLERKQTSKHATSVVNRQATLHAIGGGGR